MAGRLPARIRFTGRSGSALTLGLALALTFWAGLSGTPTACAQVRRLRATAASGARSDQGSLHYTNKRSFRIPFDIDKDGRAKIKEVQLWSTEDSGNHWKPVSRTTPDRPSFTFRAARDGEFWFAVRIFGVDGQFYPSIDEDIVPGMKVLVDTKPPTLVLEPDGRRGTVAAVRWEVRDENLDPKSLVIEYHAEGVREWRKVPVRTFALIGSQKWDVGTADAVQVRAVVADKAGNETVAKLVVPEGVASLPESSSDDQEEFTRPPSITQVPDRSDNSGIMVGPGFGPVSEEPEANRPQSTGGGRPVKDLVARSQPRARLSQAERAGDSAFGDRPEQSAPMAAVSVFDRLPASPGVAAAAAVMSQTQPSAFGSPNNAVMTPATNAPSGNPNESLLVASPRFSLRYAVDDAGPNGPATVELWVTRDGGRTWIPRGGDPDKTSPIEVDLGGEGTFGIRLVSRSAFGLGDQPPAPGDPPDRWVEVDSSPPLVQLYKPEVGTGEHAGKVAIAWRASDSHLAPRSTRLLWRPDQAGAPWQPIVEGQENSGQFIWAVPPGIPGKFHLRVEAADTVGHLGGGETTDSGPIIVDRSRPRSRIIGVLDPNARAGSFSPSSMR
jgi:hypothetical protein